MDRMDIKQLMKTNLSKRNIDNEALNTISTAIKAIISFIIQYTVQLGNELGYNKIKINILDKINTDNQILYDLKNMNDNITIKLHLHSYIFKLYNTHNKNITISKSLIEKINDIANYYYSKFIGSANKITNNKITNEITASFSKELAQIILNEPNNDNDSESFNMSDYEQSVTYKNYDNTQNNNNNTNNTNNDLFDTQLTLDSDANKIHSYKFTSNSHSQSVPILEIISTYKL